MACTQTTSYDFCWRNCWRLSSAKENQTLAKRRTNLHSSPSNQIVSLVVPTKRLCNSKNARCRRSHLVHTKAGSIEQSNGDSSCAEDLSETLSLDAIRASLIRQEDSIIFGLIERAQFKHNAAAYQPNKIPVPMFDRCSGQRCSFLEYYLKESEQMHGKMRRYTSPDELAFYPRSLPALVLPPLKFPPTLKPNNISINDEILALYLDEIVPAITQTGDDNNYGSTCMNDVTCLQALSKRIHYGKFVAEAKFLSDPDKYIPLIEAQDGSAILESLTYPAVERKVVNRVFRKAASYGQEIMDESTDVDSNEKPQYKVEPETVANLYDKWIMPLTKKVQVKYLLRRLDQ